jgi:hypothetical protein
MCDGSANIVISAALTTTDTYHTHHPSYSPSLPIQDVALVKGPWTDEEDAKVLDLVATHGAKRWSLIASHLPGRIGKQCRERWYYYY